MCVPEYGELKRDIMEEAHSSAYAMHLGSTNDGTQPEFPFPNSRDPSGTPTDSKKKKQTFYFV